MIELEDIRQEKAILALDGKEDARNLIDVIRSKKYNYSWGGINEPIHYNQWDWIQADDFDVDISIDCDTILLSMPERTRAIFILYYFWNWNQERIAELFGYNRSYISRLMKQEIHRLGGVI